MKIAIVGDRHPEYEAHRATDAAFSALGVAAEWLPTPTLDGGAAGLDGFQGVLIAPGTPYASMEGALAAIRRARERSLPLLATCGGFQHVVVEFARNVAGIAGADHAETNPEADELVIVPLNCSLSGQRHPVTFEQGTLAGTLYPERERVEPFFCSFGLNPEFRPLLEGAGLRFSGFDRTGEPRVLELPEHPFFLATLYVPQAASTADDPHPLLTGFLDACDRAVRQQPAAT